MQQLYKSPREQKCSRGPTRPWDERLREGEVNKGLLNETALGGDAELPRAGPP